MWRNHPEGVVIIDVRTPEEYIFVGHPEMARNIPLLFVRYQWDHEKDAPVVEPNPDFVSSVAAAFKPTDTLLLMCRSGSRSALAVNALAQAGFHHVYNIVDGMEGDKVDDEESAYHGKRMRNGWKNSGLPWTYDVDPPLLWTSPRL
jgi:rhodanese-related sulfurtransferase